MHRFERRIISLLIYGSGDAGIPHGSIISRKSIYDVEDIFEY